MLLPKRYRLRLSGGVAIAAALATLACALRAWAAGGDLWLDEVWSIQLAEQIAAPWEIATRLRSDNNHMLNTAYVAWLGGDRPLLHYRLMSIVAGTLSVVVAGGIAAERGPIAQRTAMFLTGTSLLMVHYGSEARGYALVMLLALAAYGCLRRFLLRQQARWAIAFACCAALGFLAHPTFLYFYLATGYASVTTLPVIGRRWPETVKPMLILHGLPLGTLLVLYLVNFRHFELGGGPGYQLASVLAQTGSLAVGGPALGAGAIVGALVLVAAVTGSLWVLWRQGDQQWTTLALCVSLPLVAAVATHAPFLFVRYFLIAVVFAQLLCAFGLAWLYRQGRAGRFAFCVLLALFATANLSHLGNLFQARRGHYLAALQYISDQDSSSRITIGSNHDHGSSILIDFYRQRISMPREIEYCRVGDWPAPGPEWLILHHDPADGPSNYGPRYVVGGQTYRFSKKFDAAILSGWQWFCYRRVDREAPLAGNSLQEMKSVQEMLNVAAVSDR